MYKKGKCALCGFEPVDACQLTIDHKDGNRRNNDKDNLQTLCRNCHALKSLVNGDFFGNAYKKTGRVAEYGFDFGVAG